MPTVSIIIPVIRPDKAERCVKAIRENAGLLEGPDYEIITEVDKNRIGCPKMVKRLTDRSKGEMVCFLGDDTIPQKNFLVNAVRAMRFMPEDPQDKVKWGLVSFNDNVNTSRTAAHWLAHKRLLPLLDGEFFHTGYGHCYCDDELMIRAQQMGRYIYAYDAILYHDHPLVQKDAKVDDYYRKVYGEQMKKDHALFLNRMNNKWKTVHTLSGEERKMPLRVVIGIPSGEMLHTDFAMALVNLCIKSYMAGIHCIIVSQKSSIVEVGRCEIVNNAIQLDADKLLFLDSDMTFPADLLVKLIAHDKPVVGCDASQKREPFATVITGMDGKKLDHSGDAVLVEVKGASCACQLIDRKVLAKLPEPPFMVTWGDRGFLGEDYYFSNAVRKAGFKIYVDMPLSKKIGHIGMKTYFIPAKVSPVSPVSATPPLH